MLKVNRFKSAVSARIVDVESGEVQRIAMYQCNNIEDARRLASYLRACRSQWDAIHEMEAGMVGFFK